MQEREAKVTRNLAIWLSLLSLIGCSTLLYSPRNAHVRNEITRADFLAARGDYEKAISKYEQVLEKSPQNPWRDQVLFSLGCLYASNENPDRDFGRSLYCFQRLKRDFPKSRFKARIKVWTGLLENLVSLESQLKAKTAEFARKKCSWAEEMAALKLEKQELESLWSGEISLKENRIKELENLIQNQKTAIEALQQQLEKMKEIDIQSEKKASGIK